MKSNYKHHELCSAWKISAFWNWNFLKSITSQTTFPSEQELNFFFYISPEILRITYDHKLNYNHKDYWCKETFPEYLPNKPHTFSLVKAETYFLNKNHNNKVPILKSTWQICGKTGCHWQLDLDDKLLAPVAQLADFS